MSDQDQLPTLTITGTTEDGRQVPIQLPLDVGWRMMEIISILGTDQAFKFAQTILFFDRKVMGYPPDVSPPEDPYILEDITRDNLDLFIHSLAILTPPGKTETDRLLQFTYTLVQAKKLTWKGAAQLASQTLGGGFTETAWRLRVKRWAESRGKKPVGVYKRKQET